MIGMRSSVEDLLIWGAAFLNSPPEGRPNPLKELDAILQGYYWTRDNPDEFHNPWKYRLSWLECIMPSSMTHWGSWNMTVPGDGDEQAYVDNHILGRDSPQRKLYKTVGKGFCGTGSLIIFPETKTVIVVLSSGLNMGDSSDFTAAVLMQELFQLKLRVDIRSMVLKECTARTQAFQDIVAEWRDHRNVSESVLERPAEEYVGKYAALGITLEVRQRKHSDGLELVLNGREDMVENLDHYNEDMYSYLPTDRDTWLRYGWLDWDYYLVGILHFRRDANSRVHHLTWTWERGCDPAFFDRKDS